VTQPNATTEVRLAVVENEVKNLANEVGGIKRALWGVATAIIGAVFVFALSVASGLVG